MREEGGEQGMSLPKPTEITFPKQLRGAYTPTLNKVQSFENTLFCGYSNGLILHYRYDTLDKRYSFLNKVYPYQNTDVIDIDLFDHDVLLTCSHHEVTLFNLTKNKSIALKGHETTPIAVSAHPISPYVVSVSNAIVEHDVRMQRPINVNFITPPAYDIEFFPDGKEFLLSGEPTRIGRSRWVRTLMNGISKPSLNSKLVVTNEMNGNLSVWDWRESQRVGTISGVRNQNSYQPVYFGLKSGTVKDIYFFQDDGYILKYEIGKNTKIEHKLFDVSKGDNWKMVTRTIGYTTKSVILYQHRKALMKIYDL